MLDQDTTASVVAAAASAAVSALLKATDVCTRLGIRWVPIERIEAANAAGGLTIGLITEINDATERLLELINARLASIEGRLQ